MSKLNEYLRHFENTIHSSPLIRAYEMHIDRKTQNIAYIHGKIDFADGSVLDFKEFVCVVIAGVEKYKYSYNYRNRDVVLFRYDNANDPRARNLSTFPHHAHLLNDKIEESSVKDITDIIKEIDEILITENTNRIKDK